MRLLLLLLIAPLHAEKPWNNTWGKDFDLHYHTPPIPPSPSTGIFQRLGAALISIHQEVISPADGPRSHFYPSSSQYTRLAMDRYGFVPGFILGCDRLMRENDAPWIYPKVIGPEGNLLKYDPVP